MPKKITDLSGQQFNHWTVLSQDLEKSIPGKTYWLCQCDCKNKTIKSVRSDHLKKGTSSSCGCKRTESVRNNIENIVGKKFNHLTVLEQYIKYSENSTSGATWCKCQCDCENKTIKEVSAAALKSGSIKSCGCLKLQQITELGKSKLIDLTGKKFYHLTVLERDKTIRYGTNQTIYWKCQCDCANKTIKIISGTHLKEGTIRSCGLCQGKSRGEEYISKILNFNNIIFETQKTFKSCYFSDTNKLAYFDFYLPNYNTVIEYDGQQHFYYKNSGWDTEEAFKKRKEHDFLKNDWCLSNNINIIRIPYTHLDNLSLEDLLPNTSKFLIRKENNNGRKTNDN